MRKIKAKKYDCLYIKELMCDKELSNVLFKKYIVVICLNVNKELKKEKI
jgi:hypothetical protein